MQGPRPNDQIDEIAIREFIAVDYPRVVAAVRLVAGDGAEDAVAEALARAWERSAGGTRIETLAAWVTRVALNLATSRWRHLRVEKLARPRLARPEEEPISSADDRLDIERALTTLSRREREVVVLRYYLGMDVADVAATLRVTGGTAKTLLHRARTKLADQLSELDTQEANVRAELR